MDKEINQLIENRKQYLDSQKVVKSPSKVQWEIYRYKRVEPREILDETDLEILFGTLVVLGLSSLSVGVVALILSNFILGFLGILVGVLLFILALLPIKGLPTQDNKLATMSRDRREQCSKLHELIYVKGEFYRVWYARYVLCLDEREFERTDKINRVLNRERSYSRFGYHDPHTYVSKVYNDVDDSEIYDRYSEELTRIRQLKSSANNDREDWLNGMVTTRFLDYKEFMSILKSEKAVKEVKELDSKVSQFEYYMNNKERFKNKEG